jgi:hypothetical protein
MSLCLLCNHHPNDRRRDGRCGSSGTGSKRTSPGACLCSCVYETTRFALRVRGEGRFLGAEGVAVPALEAAARFTYAEARAAAERSPFAVDPIEVR